jgi:hypothetical protein
METKKATEVKKCNTCKKGLSNTQKSTVFIGVYIIATSIYGTVSLINQLISIFK